MKFLLLSTFLTGCSAELVERLSTDTYMGYKDAQEPTLFEVPLWRHELKTEMGVEEDLWINNPLPYGIDVNIECSSIFQADLTVHVKARSTRYILATRLKQNYAPSCSIVSYGLEKPR